MKKYFLIALLIFVCAFVARISFISNIPHLYFDEINYVYDALKYLNGVFYLERESQAVPKHPMISIFFMRQGIAMFGNTPLGWRFFSALFGALSAVLLFFLGKELFNWRTGILSAFFLTISPLHIVLSRIAMVEVYLVFFLLLAFCLLAFAIKRKNNSFLIWSGIFFGLALATKWVALLSVLGALAIYSHTKMPRPSRCGFGVGIYLFLSKDRGKGHRAIGSLLFLPMIVFFVASMLLNLSSGMTVISWLQYEVRNFHYHQIFSYLHPYNVSSWLWPFWASTPMFEGKRSVIAMGNPFVLWLMVPVLGYLCCRWWKERDAALLFILIGFFVNYLSWLVYDLLGLTPFFKSRGLFFYYFMPALPFYFIGLGYLLDKMLSHKYARLAAWTYLLAVVLSFAVLSPVAYGMEGWLTVIWKR